MHPVISTFRLSASRSHSYLKAKARHTALIFGDGILTFLLRIIAIREEHAFVTSGFFVFAYTTGL